jgi:hypothetical protein
MSPFMKTVILWAAIILLIGYLLNIDIGGFITGIIHAAQQIHSQHGGH